MSAIDTAFNSIANLKLWFNNQSGTSLKLSDMSEIIPLRWAYFRDNWEFIQPIVVAKIKTYVYPDLLKTQIDALTGFIDVHRNNQNKNVNPFQVNTILSTFYAVWDNIDIGSIPLTRQETTIIQNKLTTIRNYIQTDFVNIRNNIVAARDNIADITGTEDATYNQVFGRNSASPLRTISLSDIVNMQTLQNSIQTIDFVLANSGSLSTTTIDPFALARVNANNPDVTINSNQSGQLVRMFFGDSLESMAFRYLNDSNRWIEIAIANGLKPPYIDEIGFTIPLLSNGNGNQINIANADAMGNLNRNSFYVNQIVFLQSNSHRQPDQRLIVNIKQVPVSGEIILELSGLPNLSMYTLADVANVRVYAPNTINSNFMVLIPSPQAPNVVPSNEVPFFLASKSEDEKRAGVDLAINGNGDIVFSSNSDLQLSFGLANALQAVQLKMMSERGQNPRHPNFGIPPVIGTKGDQPNIVKQALVTGISDMISADARFDRIESLNVKVGGGAARISLVVRLAGSGSLVPISFTISLN